MIRLLNRVKDLLRIEDDKKREKLLESHHKIGRSFKTDIHAAEISLEVIEKTLMVR